MSQTRSPLPLSPPPWDEHLARVSESSPTAGAARAAPEARKWILRRPLIGGDQFFVTQSLTNLHCWAQPRSLLQKGLETVTGVPGFAVGPSLNGLKWSEWGPL